MSAIEVGPGVIFGAGSYIYTTNTAFTVAESITFASGEIYFNGLAYCLSGLTSNFNTLRSCVTAAIYYDSGKIFVPGEKWMGDV